MYICDGNNDIYPFRNVLVGLCLVLQVAVYFSQPFRTNGTFRVFTLGPLVAKSFIATGRNLVCN